MKKFLIATVMLLGSISLVNAEQFRVGIAVMGAGFEADGAKEVFSGDHSSNTTSTKVTKSSSSMNTVTTRRPILRYYNIAPSRRGQNIQI